MALTRISPFARGTSNGDGYGDLLKQFEATAEKARLSNLERAEQIKAIHGEIIRRYEPGGPFEEKGLAMLKKQKRRDVGAEMQQMISSGLYGTTTAAGAPRRWEEAVGEPGRMRLEDIMMQRLSQAQLGMAGFMERIEEPYPDYGALMQATAAGAAGGGGGDIGMTRIGAVGGTQQWGSYGAAAQPGYTSFDTPTSRPTTPTGGGTFGSPTTRHDLAQAMEEFRKRQEQPSEAPTDAPPGFRYTETGINPYTRKKRYTLTAL